MVMVQHGETKMIRHVFSGFEMVREEFRHVHVETKLTA